MIVVQQHQRDAELGVAAEPPAENEQRLLASVRPCLLDKNPEDSVNWKSVTGPTSPPHQEAEPAEKQEEPPEQVLEAPPDLPTEPQDVSRGV